MSSSQPRINIRCPQCGKDGSARAELLNRRVGCKHCSHVFRVTPIDGNPATAPVSHDDMVISHSTSSASAIIPGSPALAAVGQRSRERIEALELELRKLRDELSAQHPDETVIESLKDQLAQANEAARKAQGTEASLRKEIDQLRDQLEQTIETTGDESKNHLRDEELRFLRDQLDKARAEVQAETKKRRETASTLNAKTLEHDEALRNLQQELEAVRNELREKAEAQARSVAEIASIRDELGQANRAIESANRERDRLVADHSESLEASKEQLVRLESRFVEAEATRTHRDHLARELEHLQKRLAEVEQSAVEQKDQIEALKLDRDRVEAEKLAEIGDLKTRLDKALESAADSAILRQELEETRADRDRLVGEVESLHDKMAQAVRQGPDPSYPSTEIDLPVVVDPLEAGGEVQAESQSTVFDDGAERLRAEADELRGRLADLTERLEHQETEFAERIARTESETKELRRALYDARFEAENASKAQLELGQRVRELEEAEAMGVAEATPEIDRALIEDERRKAVEDAVKGAWADFERRLADTQSKLKAANARADLMEAEAREAREQIVARERSLDLMGDSSSFGGEVASLTSLRILEARGTARLTQADADARLGLARQLAVDRKDKPLIDRISKMTDKVRADLEARNYTLAETLVRGAEIETGLDPGGFSINGLRIFRASPTIVGSLNALAPAFDRVMRDGELEAIQTTIDELKTILGDQAGLPEIRWPGRTPTTKRPIARPEAFRLFMDALIAESWLVRPVVQKKPLPDTSLGTYASLVEATCVARKAAETLDPEQISFLDEIIQAACLMLTRRQQADGHFPFLDPRGKPSKAATVVDGMVAQRSDAVKDGWVIHVDPIGLAQVETGPCAIALATAAKLLGREEWFRASQKAAEWAVGQPCLPNFAANAASLGLLARSYLDTEEDPHLVGLVRKLTLGLLPGQSPNGRWVDPESATTSKHLVILRGMLDAWEAIPSDRSEMLRHLRQSIDLALSSLLEECKALGVPVQGGILVDLIRHRNLFPDDQDPRLEPAILDSATVIQELCHDGPKPRLGVAADQLSALMLI